MPSLSLNLQNSRDSKFHLINSVPYYAKVDIRKKADIYKEIALKKTSANFFDFIPRIARVHRTIPPVTYRKSDESWNPAAGRGLSGKRSRPSPTLLLGLDVDSATSPFLTASAIFFERPRRFSRLPVLSIVVALRNKHGARAYSGFHT